MLDSVTAALFNPLSGIQLSEQCRIGKSGKLLKKGLKLVSELDNGTTDLRKTAVRFANAKTSDGENWFHILFPKDNGFWV